MRFLSSVLAMAAVGTTTARQRRDRDAYMAPPPPPPPSQPPTITPSWRIPLGLAWAILVFVVAGVVGVMWQQWEIRQGLKELRYGVWTIEDQKELERRAALGGLFLPNTQLIVRDRLPGPIHQP